MGQMITKPDANPVLLAAGNFIFGGLGYFFMGQKKKALMAAGMTCLSMCACGLGMFVACVFVYDAYLLAGKLQSGQAIGENENGLPFLDVIFKD